MRSVVVYFKPGCPFAAKLRVGLTLRRIRYSSVRFGDDEAAAAAVRAITGGDEISPTVLVDGSYLPHPRARDVHARVAT
jgi:glutaredoxin